MTPKIAVIVIIAIFLIFLIGFLTSRKTEKYTVICIDSLFENVKKSYRPGETVKIYFPYVATDTDYFFYLDGERIGNYSYSDKKGFVITFTMPAHDVELTCDSRNSMVAYANAE